MPERDVASVLARLLSSGAERRAFAASRAAWLDAAGADASAHAVLLAMDAAALEVQAKGLIAKRRAEVRKLLPRAAKLLGEAYSDYFDAYAEEHWPEGHRRHLRDALCFAETLANSGVVGLDHDIRRLRFLLDGRRFGLAVSRSGVQILLRGARHIREWRIPSRRT